jgi:hypothetical protein
MSPMSRSPTSCTSFANPEVGLLFIEFYGESRLSLGRNRASTSNTNKSIAYFDKLSAVAYASDDRIKVESQSPAVHLMSGLMMFPFVLPKARR